MILQDIVLVLGAGASVPGFRSGENLMRSIWQDILEYQRKWTRTTADNVRTNRRVFDSAVPQARQDRGC